MRASILAGGPPGYFRGVVPPVSEALADVLLDAEDTARGLVGGALGVGLVHERRRYGPHPAQVAWTWRAAAGPLPVVVLLHGGGFVRGSPAQLAALGPRLARRGALAVAAGYRLGLPWPAALDDVLALLDTLPRAALVGFSAGGHLALHAAARRPVLAVVGVGVPVDLRAVAEAHLDAIFPDRAAASPIALPGPFPPVRLVHGERDPVAPIASVRAFAAARPDVELVEVPGGDHGLRRPLRAGPRARADAVAWALARAADSPGP